MSTDLKLNKTQLSLIIQSDRFLSNMIGIFGKEILTKFAVPLAKDVLHKLATKAALSVIDKFERKLSERGQVKDSLY